MTKPTLPLSQILNARPAIHLQQRLLHLLLLVNKEPAIIRRKLFEHPRFGLLLFNLYYFTPSLTYPFSNAHIDYVYDLQRLLQTDHPTPLTALLVKGARNSGKTALATNALTYTIPYSLQKYATVSSSDITNSGAYLYQSRTTLLSNKQLIADHGLLIPRQRVDKETGLVNRSKAEDYIALNQIKTRLEAISVNQTLRGRLYDQSRITFLLADDIETVSSIRSEVITDQIRQQLSESENAMSDQARLLLLGNKLTNFGNVAALEEKYSRISTAKITDLALHKSDPEKTITWDTKYTHTRQQANQLNSKYPLINLQSVEAIEERNTSFDFAAEFLGLPMDNQLAMFKPEMFQYIDEATIQDFQSPFHPTHIAMSLDTAVTANDSSDYTALTIRYWNNDPEHHDISVIEVERYRMLPDQAFALLTRTFHRLRQKYPIATFMAGWEKTNSTLSLQPFWDKHQTKHALPFSLHLLDHKNKKKEDRIISSLLYQYETRKIYHLTRHNPLTNTTTNTCEHLEKELILFPVLNKTDDCADSAAHSFNEYFNKRAVTKSSYATTIATNPARQRALLRKRRGW